MWKSHYISIYFQRQSTTEFSTSRRRGTSNAFVCAMCKGQSSQRFPDLKTSIFESVFIYRMVDKTKFHCLQKFFDAVMKFCCNRRKSTRRIPYQHSVNLHVKLRRCCPKTNSEFLPSVAASNSIVITSSKIRTNSAQFPFRNLSTCKDSWMAFLYISTETVNELMKEETRTNAFSTETASIYLTDA